MQLNWLIKYKKCNILTFRTASKIFTIQNILTREEPVLLCRYLNY